MTTRAVKRRRGRAAEAKSRSDGLESVSEDERDVAAGGQATLDGRGSETSGGKRKKDVSARSEMELQQMAQLFRMDDVPSAPDGLCFLGKTFGCAAASWSINEDAVSMRNAIRAVQLAGGTLRTDSPWEYLIVPDHAYRGYHYRRVPVNGVRIAVGHDPGGRYRYAYFSPLVVPVEWVIECQVGKVWYDPESEQVVHQLQRAQLFREAAKRRRLAGAAAVQGLTGIKKSKGHDEQGATRINRSRGHDEQGVARTNRLKRHDEIVPLPRSSSPLTQVDDDESDYPDRRLDAVEEDEEDDAAEEEVEDDDGMEQDLAGELAEGLDGDGDGEGDEDAASDDGGGGSEQDWPMAGTVKDTVSHDSRIPLTASDHASSTFRYPDPDLPASKNSELPSRVRPPHRPVADGIRPAIIAAGRAAGESSFSNEAESTSKMASDVHGSSERRMQTVPGVEDHVVHTSLPSLAVKSSTAHPTSSTSSSLDVLQELTDSQGYRLDRALKSETAWSASITSIDEPERAGPCLLPFSLVSRIRDRIDGDICAIEESSPLDHQDCQFAVLSALASCLARKALLDKSAGNSAGNGGTIAVLWQSWSSAARTAVSSQISPLAGTDSVSSSGPSDVKPSQGIFGPDIPLLLVTPPAAQDLRNWQGWIMYGLHAQSEAWICDQVMSGSSASTGVTGEAGLEMVPSGTGPRGKSTLDMAPMYNALRVASLRTRREPGLVPNHGSLGGAQTQVIAKRELAYIPHTIPGPIHPPAAHTRSSATGDAPRSFSLSYIDTLTRSCITLERLWRLLERTPRERIPTKREPGSPHWWERAMDDIDRDLAASLGSIRPYATPCAAGTCKDHALQAWRHAVARRVLRKVLWLSLDDEV